MPRAAASVRTASPLTPLQRLALGRAWAGGHDALALPRGEQGPGVSTWRPLPARGRVCLAAAGRGLVLDTQRHPVARVIYRERGAAALSGARGG